ncbi:PEP-CTERM sorting domain-containing protein [Phycisphaera mikurensis]|uniref:Ice-binding protein C-terminal domain-containing protein n=1 Tax=Phycisphaera mikurensis (strain NBRC 102666 / KCTC 22515 / FYK2301M01) TaxID=1142394 RepID=I0IFM0_PHYMF|nr:PEP-CTERM sorting domain-containing protein [Phycisphaera mikurensis]MBB6440551.1 hypothetical protein [Phycisphaera mikurensis]BAM04058.1 hypothetical protein PSMK_18990 [Phycisphaera mikurensis NBRC 102666]
MKTLTLLSAAASLAAAGSASAITLDGQNIPSEGLTLLATQQNATGFGNATGGGQDSAGGGELNQIFGDYNAATGNLELGITGNVEGNFNKLFLFFDGVAGGENVLANDNADGGFGEVNALAGLTFDSGFTADHGLRFEIGSGFYGVNAFDLIDNTAVSVVSGGGPGDLPLSNVGSNGVQVGWDNSNVLGVTDADASLAASATTGIELEIDLAAFFGTTEGDIKVAAIYTSADGTFASNQLLGSLPAGTGNLGDPTVVDLNTLAGEQFVTISAPVVPEPASLALLGLGGLLIAGRRRG